MTHSPTDAPPDGHGRHGSTDQSAEADKHVFVDSTGRRALLLRRAGIVLGAAFLVYGGMVGVSFMGGPSLAPAQISPFDSVGSTQEQGTNERVNKDGSPSARSSAKPCRKQCRKNRNCRKHPKQCRRKALRRAADGRTGASRPQTPRSGQPAPPEQTAQPEQTAPPQQTAPATVR